MFYCLCVSVKYIICDDDNVKPLRCHTERGRRTDGHNNAMGALKMTDMKLQDMKLTDRVAGHEIAGHENGGPNSRT